MPTEPSALLNDPLAGLDDADAAVRRLAVSACAARVGDPMTVAALRAVAVGDPDEHTRAQAVELLGGAPSEVDFLLELLGDEGVLVAEAAATSLGELESSEAVDSLMAVAADHTDKLLREAAVASLGAIGDERSRELLIGLTNEAPPQIRRRAVVALTAYDGPDIEEALKAARHDRNPMVREVAEAIIGPELPGLDQLKC